MTAAAIVAYITDMDGRVFAGLIVGFLALCMYLPGLIVRLKSGRVQ